ncbi:hypothetical protein MG293_017326 [Ovis ammon polii]|uniref:Uncharacterized protein n=1 Tax=Ovis ammon polii TaxID=230172 RepID=A0AAD4Y375_OVIAM|nr:hypothetical protein MG293_017326 [Ovis ammon polii]
MQRRLLLPLPLLSSFSHDCSTRDLTGRRDSLGKQKSGSIFAQHLAVSQLAAASEQESPACWTVRSLKVSERGSLNPESEKQGSKSLEEKRRLQQGLGLQEQGESIKALKRSVRNVSAAAHLQALTICAVLDLELGEAVALVPVARG